MDIQREEDPDVENKQYQEDLEFVLNNKKFDGKSKERLVCFMMYDV